MEEWIRCPHCGHKLMLLKVRAAGIPPEIEIKCSSCKKIVQVSKFQVCAMIPVSINDIARYYENTYSPENRKEGE